MKKLSLSLLLVCMFGVAKGADPVKVGELYYQLSATNASVSKVPADVAQYQGDVIIPGTITYGGKAYAVNSIDKEAFSGAAQVTSVNIPSSIQSINTDAFKDCSGLKTVTFSSAASFSNVVFTNSASNPLSAGDAQLAFANEDNSTDITLASIKKYAFSGYKKEGSTRFCVGQYKSKSP